MHLEYRGGMVFGNILFVGKNIFIGNISSIIIIYYVTRTDINRPNHYKVNPCS